MSQTDNDKMDQVNIRKLDPLILGQIEGIHQTPATNNRHTSRDR